MSAYSQLIALAERCEKATGSSFDLNSLIACQDWYREEFGDCADDEVPDFGGSVDAGLTLIPNGFGWNLQGNTNIFYAVVWGQFSKPCTTSALALTAAALRARAALLKASGGGE